MGTAQIQGELWGSRAGDWSEANEPAWRPLFSEVLRLAGAAPGKCHLDVGCGAGGALAIARSLGAEVAGLDASARLVEVARRKLPGARIEIGEMEELPFADASFDLVTGINSFQFASDPVRALSEARRICAADGTVITVVWGRRDDCQLITVTMPAVLALLLPAPQPAAAGPTFSEPGVIEDMMLRAGLSPTGAGEIAASLAFPDAGTAVRAIMAAGPSVKAIAQVGESTVAEAIAGTLGPVTQSDGRVVFSNRFRWVTATPTRARL